MLYKALSIASIAGLASAHGRWKCPTARDELDDAGNHITFDNTANKYADCGPKSGAWGFGEVYSLQPGPMTLTWEESISHTGSPFRIAIMDETETARIVLLDHIPHNEDSKPDRDNEDTYVEYKITVTIPDLKCSKCTMQLLYVMTDKTVNCGSEICYYDPDDAACKGSTDPDAATCAGAPNSNVCAAEDVCFSNYHSCFDFTIEGTQPFESFAFDSQPSDWPYKSMDMNYYGAEIGTWEYGWLTGIPKNYTQDVEQAECN